jgi:hypothetical protein
MRIQVKAAIRTDLMASTVPLCEFVPECVNDFETLALGKAVYKRMWKYNGKMERLYEACRLTFAGHGLSPVLFSRTLTFFQLLSGLYTEMVSASRREFLPRFFSNMIPS